MADHITLFAALAAAVSGWCAIRHSRLMLHEGMTLSDGGGWTALLLTELMVCFAGLGVALS